ncbi:nitric oxide reductase, NorZ apoprotein [Halogeometricum borinquense DSM 11551]|uniref:Nitric oxide reductase, NorZ apoprotein n=1 Tax=Halogeometricum borinquense (strain ATCC 700274 / DSM 11551 / JCM 10706 / KCTC 4070 / PR3) TaxID=469382 RepID=E4NUW2_HALBP|nr:cbb3-type cytochrome c oxidase subunit I [Halogeometricum borinquense]ADQ68951.1 nitric oxide reductase, NorZ apoprotein [Halogeometricum borinquense DSM 11551]ELY29125.1 nitric oxide reductase, NorZ apoprotein [Halogeometricum borinquense DSM 11551]
MKVSRQTIAKALVAVFIINLVVMGVGAYYSSQHVPPIPKEVVGPDGDVIVTQSQVQNGKIAFQKDGLMNHGSILGNGAYYGVDYTADALDLKVQYMREYYAQERHGSAYEKLDTAEQASVNSLVRADLDESLAKNTETIRYSAAEVYAHEQAREEYVQRYHEGSAERGLPADFIGSAEDARRFADFAMWTAWISHTDRPGSDHSFTNEWPYNPAAGNAPTGSTMTWSVISMVLLVAAVGIGVWLYNSVELPEPEITSIEVPPPDEISLSPSQRAATRFIPLAGALFALQVLLGGLLAHYYVERHAFFGIEKLFGVELISVLPFSLAKTFHLDLAILWIASLWLGAGLFLPPLLTNYEPPRQKTYIHVLLGALIVAAVGGLAGIWFGAQGYIDGALWWILGNEGLEYLEVGRLWQVGLLVGFVLWTALVWRGFRPLIKRESRYGLAHLIVYAGGSIGLLFTAGMLYTPQTNIVMTEFWRWWVVHMWVEGAFEFFIVSIVGLTLVSMGLLKKRSAEKAVAFQALFVMGSGVIGAAHHYWWVGQPDVWVPLGSVFSTLELIPLILILFEAMGQYRALATSDDGFPYTLPFMFIIASGFWNFVGAGVLGFFINLPLINYYEHGTYLTVGHAHAAMFGAFGFLALGMATYMLRISAKPAQWTGKRLRWAFWLWNIGLAVMVFVSVLPVGFLQLETAFTQSYAAARSLAFYNGELVQLLFWARLPGDTMIILGTLVFAYDMVKKRFTLRPVSTPGEAPSGTIPDRVMAEDDD